MAVRKGRRYFVSQIVPNSRLSTYFVHLDSLPFASVSQVFPVTAHPIARKFAGWSLEERLIYQLIEGAGNRGKLLSVEKRRSVDDFLDLSLNF